MLKIQPLTIALFVAFSFTKPAVAHESPQSYDRVNFQVSAAEEVANDTLVAVMYSEVSGQKSSAVADEVNRNISWAADLAKKSSSVKVQTLHYRQDPLYNKQSIIGWKIRQSIRLESKDVESLSALIGEIQERLSVASIQYTVSPTRRDEVERRLIAEALNRFENRGKQIEVELGRTGYRIVNIDVITSNQPLAPVRMRAAAIMEGSAVAAPVIEPGAQTVSVQVSGTIELTLPK